VGFDLYRLRRSWSLQVSRLPEGDAYAINGGTEPHLVRFLDARWSCDCADHAKGRTCKHLIRRSRHQGDDEVLRADADLSLRPQTSPIDLRTWWIR